MDKTELIKELNSPELRLLKTFLEKVGIYDEFIEDYSNGIIPTGGSSSTTSLKKHTYNMEYILFNSFYWDRTTQGLKFWLNIHNKWLIFYKKYKDSKLLLEI